MRKALEPLAADVEILEVSHFPAPEGEIEFSWKDLALPASPHAASRWRGFIRYDDDRRFAIWADVRITAECRRVVAVSTLRPGLPIRAEQVREETYQGFPLGKNLGLEDVAGRALLRTVRSGDAITQDLLVEPMVIAKGAPLIAEYISGRIRLKIPVVAERAGRMGEMISVRNPSSQKVFAARVRGEGIVVVEENQIKP
jgi:flagella basal body P-ring formation protein FlgA